MPFLSPFSFTGLWQSQLHILLLLEFTCYIRALTLFKMDHQAMTELSPRVSYSKFSETLPQVRKGLINIGEAVLASGLSQELLELIDLRASQINGCAFCIQFHLNAARKLGIAPAKLDLLPAWRETDIYSPKEAAALAWTETLTSLRPDSAIEQGYVDVRIEFTEEQAIALTAAIAVINQWNRLAMAFKFTPPFVARSPDA